MILLALELAPSLARTPRSSLAKNSPGVLPLVDRSLCRPQSSLGATDRAEQYVSYTALGSRGHRTTSDD